MSAPEESGVVELLAWDSEFWGVRAARTHASTYAQLLTAEQAYAEQGIEWASLLVPVKELDLINAAVGLGYCVTDIRYTMVMSLGPRQSFDPATVGTSEDAEELANLAADSLRESRFFADEHLDDNRCATFYRTWVHNSFSGQMADAVLVARSNQGADGFITVKRHAEGRTLLPLVAVRPDRQGKGVGRQLLAATLDWTKAHGASSVEVVTQLTNVPAIRLYSSCGFRLQNSAVWLHRWPNDKRS